MWTRHLPHSQIGSRRRNAARGVDQIDWKMASRTWDVEDAGVSKCSTIIGVLSCVSAGLLRKCLLNSKASSVHLHLYMVAKTIEAWKNSLEEMIVHVRRSSRPWVRVDTRALQFWTPSMTVVTLFLVARVVSLVVTGTWVPATILWFPIRVFIGIDFLLPFFHIGHLKVATIWDPDGFPAAYPFGHRHYKGQGHGTVVQRSTMTEEQNNKNHAKCGVRAQAVAGPHVSFQKVQ